ncbi:MAG: hypothetical protein ACUVUC_03235 [Thermoguttaceae bacterium]
MPREPEKPVLRSADEGELSQYRPVSGLAVVALVVGGISGLALLHPLFWFLPPIGLVLALVSLRQISSAWPALAGRPMAMVGLALSVGVGAAAPTDFLYYRWNVRNEARQFARLWFDLLRRNEPHKALQLCEHPSVRQPLDDKLWDFYPEGSEPRERLEGFVARRHIHALLILGDQAEVSYCGTESQWTEEEVDFVIQSFAVTFFSPKQEKESFFIRLVLARNRGKDTGRAYWRIARHDGGILPVAFGGKLPSQSG